MGQSENDAAARFGEVLRGLMRERGHAVEGARSGVDIAKLAKAAGITYEMARRYVQGMAIPRPAKLQKIAEWLGVQASALAFGAEAAQTAIDEGRLQTCIEAVTEAQARTGRQLTTEKAAHLVALLYAESAGRALPAAESVDLMVRALA